MLLGGSPKLPAVVSAVVVKILLVVVLMLEVEIDVRDAVLEAAAEEISLAAAVVAAATGGTLTVIPDKLAHSWTNALPKSEIKSDTGGQTVIEFLPTLTRQRALL